MVRYYRRYRRYRPRRYIRRWFRRRFRRYVNGSSKSTVRLKTAVEYSGNVQVPDAATLSSVVAVYAQGESPTAGGGKSVLASPLYRTYCSLYEECKCIGMKVNVAIASQIGGTSLPSLQIYTAWDRRHGDAEGAFSAQNIKDSATYNVATALNNNVAKLTRSIYASDLMEKAQWHDCSIATAGGNYRDIAYNAADANPNFFAPAFYFCFGSPSLAAVQSPATVNYQLSIVYYYAFRNPKFGAAAGSSKMANLGGVVEEEQPAPDSDRMDDSGIIIPPLPDGPDPELEGDIDLNARAEADAAAAHAARSAARRQAAHAARTARFEPRPAVRDPKNV